MKTNQLVYYAEKRRVFIGTLGTLVFLALGILLVVFPSTRNTEIKQVVVFLFVVCPSFLFVIIGLSVLIKRSPIITISEEGLVWNVSLISAGELSWSEITSAECLNYGGVWFVNIGVANEEHFLARQPFWRRSFFRLLKYMKWPVKPTHVPGSGVKDTSAGKIAKEIRRRISASNKSLQPTSALTRRRG